MDEAEALRIGAEVRQARQDKDWTHEQLAECAQVSPDTVAAIEAGRSTPSGTLRAVFDALGIDPTAEGVSYSRDIALLQEMIGQWLLVLPEAEREDAQDQLRRFILAHM
jgi:transcriptional regulator with XRE-family HTH domain